HYARLAAVFAHGKTASMGGTMLGATSADYRTLGVPGFSALLHLRHGDTLRAERILLCKDVLDVPLPLQPDPDDCAKTPYGRLQLLRSTETRLVGMGANDRAVAGESYYPPFDVHLAMAWELFQLRGRNGGTDVV